MIDKSGVHVRSRNKMVGNRPGCTFYGYIELAVIVENVATAEIQRLA
jgi:hypothetical protein